MSTTVFVSRTSDGFILSCNAKVDRDVMKQAKTLFQNQNLLPKQISLEGGDRMYQWVYIPIMYNFVQFCTIFVQFCTIYVQFCTILYNFVQFRMYLAPMIDLNWYLISYLMFSSIQTNDVGFEILYSFSKAIQHF